MTVRERILAYLQEHPEGMDDYKLAEALGLSRRQHANQECRRLEELRLIKRQVVGGKKRNFLVASDALEAQERGSAGTRLAPDNRLGGGSLDPQQPWDWEGNVQTSAAEYLKRSGYRILRQADTLKRERGKDIIALASSGQELWVSAKGFPKGTPKTQRSTQGRHYFEGALLDLALWRGEKKQVAVAFAFPDVQTYRSLVRRSAWLLAAGQVSIFWVRKDGSVQFEGVKE